MFPDSELPEVGSVVTAMQQQGLEVRGIESLREHYGRTPRHWIANLKANWEEANRLAGPARARIWRLYMAGCCLNFEKGSLGVHQVLGVKPGPHGTSGMPPTLAELPAGPALVPVIGNLGDTLRALRSSSRQPPQGLLSPSFGSVNAGPEPSADLCLLNGETQVAPPEVPATVTRVDH